MRSTYPSSLLAAAVALLYTGSLVVAARAQIFSPNLVIRGGGIERPGGHRFGEQQFLAYGEVRLEQEIVELLDGKLGALAGPFLGYWRAPAEPHPNNPLLGHWQPRVLAVGGRALFRLSQFGGSALGQVVTVVGSAGLAYHQWRVEQVAGSSQFSAEAHVLHRSAGHLGCAIEIPLNRWRFSAGPEWIFPLRQEGAPTQLSLTSGIGYSLRDTR